MDHQIEEGLCKDAKRCDKRCKNNAIRICDVNRLIDKDHQFAVKQEGRKEWKMISFTDVD